MKMIPMEDLSSLEERLISLSKSPIPWHDKLNRIVNSQINYYEKLYFITMLYGKKTDAALELISDRILNQMSLSTLLSELLKPIIVVNAKASKGDYSSIDFSLIFSDQRQRLVEPFQKSLILNEESYFGIWPKIENLMQDHINTKYCQAMEAFIETLVNIKQHFAEHCSTQVFVSRNELDYLLNLWQWTKSSKLFNEQTFGHDAFTEINEFMKHATQYPNPVLDLPRIGQRRYLIPVLKDMDQNTVTIIGWASSGPEPNLITFRAKTHHSAQQKVAEAITALIAFYGEGLYSQVFSRFPFELSKYISSRKDAGLSTKNITENQQRIFDNIRQIANLDPTEPNYIRRLQHEWQGFSIEYKANMWNSLPKEIRSGILSGFKKVPNLVEKYNSWNDITLGDLFGLTVTATDYTLLTNSMIAVLNRDKFLEIDSDVPIDYINKPQYGAVHMNVRPVGKQVHSAEIHITSAKDLLSKDIVGPSVHNLYTKQRRSALLSWSDNKKHLEGFMAGIEDALGYRTPSNVRMGYLSSLKTCFDLYLNSLYTKGFYVPPS